MFKKFMLIFTMVLVFSSTVFATTFTDIAPNWVNDAVISMASRGIISGYPDGTFKGNQPLTRYEMASVIARSIHFIDVNKASQKDLNDLKNIVTELSEELNALGVRVNDLDNRFVVMETRLGGWAISGSLVFDGTYTDKADNKSMFDSYDDKGDGSFSRANINVEKFFDNGMHFYSRISLKNRDTEFSRFYVEFPFVWDTDVTVGRFIKDYEYGYNFNTNSDFFVNSSFTNKVVDGISLSKTTKYGNIDLYVVNPNTDNYNTVLSDDDSFEVSAMWNIDFTEKFSTLLGVQFLDLSETNTYDTILTAWAGISYNFFNTFNVKGIYYYQVQDFNIYDDGVRKVDDGYSYSGMWKAIVEIPQEKLKITSLWLEYSRIDHDFVIANGVNSLFLTDDIDSKYFNKVNSYITGTDTDIIRVGMNQDWNDKWGSWIYYSYVDFKDVNKLNNYALGIDYLYNLNVKLSLSGHYFDWNNNIVNDDEWMVKGRISVNF